MRKLPREWHQQLPYQVYTCCEALSEWTLSFLQKVVIWLLKFTSIGCPDLEISDNLGTYQHGNIMLVVCESTEKYITLRCENGGWRQDYPVSSDSIYLPLCPWI